MFTDEELFNMVVTIFIVILIISIYHLFFIRPIETDVHILEDRLDKIDLKSKAEEIKNIYDNCFKLDDKYYCE